MKKIFILFFFIQSGIALIGQNYLPRTGYADAHNNYFLEGSPQSLYHQTFELSQDSLTGKTVIGNELDNFSEFSYLINFTDRGDVQEIHYIKEGTPCTSLCHFFDPEGRYCNIQIKDNALISYERNRIDNCDQSQDGQGNIYRLIHEKYVLQDLSDSLFLTNSDTTFCIEKDSITLSVITHQAQFQYDSYPAKDSAYYAHFIDSCCNNTCSPNRTINLYNEQDQITTVIEYTPISQLPSYMEVFYYDKQGMLIQNKKFSYTTFNDSDELVRTSVPVIDTYRYEYPEKSIDEQGNWTRRYVFRQFQKEKQQPLYMECRKISYIK